MRDYRIRITKPGDNRSTYIIRKQNEVSYINASEAPIALANLLFADAAETRFALEDATDGYAACKAVHDVLIKLWCNNPQMCPKVELKSQ